jgi:hypothetical protein
MHRVKDTLVLLHTLTTYLTENAPHHGHAGDPKHLVWLLVIGGLLWAAGYAISIRLHPYRHCRVCGGLRRHYGAVYTRAFRFCRACGGTGYVLRPFAKDAD